MFINDVLNKDDVCNIVIEELKKYGVKYRKDKKTKSNQVKPGLFDFYRNTIYNCLIICRAKRSKDISSRHRFIY